MNVAERLAAKRAELERPKPDQPPVFKAHEHRHAVMEITKVHDAGYHMAIVELDGHLTVMLRGLTWDLLRKFGAEQDMEDPKELVGTLLIRRANMVDYPRYEPMAPGPKEAP